MNSQSLELNVSGIAARRTGVTARYALRTYRPVQKGLGVGILMPGYQGQWRVSLHGSV